MGAGLRTMSLINEMGNAAIREWCEGPFPAHTTTILV